MNTNKIKCTEENSVHIARPSVLINTEQLADCLGFSERHIANLVKSRRIPRLKIGKSVRFNLNAVLKSLNAYEEEALR
jgi:excisionase family DNA binding protein